ncbi:hypothetical protein C2G38_2042741 [Gigaspora rosea]|uniref:Uncharacterized protein n=1 Tax=Gigaspora rosea TaxID=44941 RepID=A0A397UQ14_9GLOM|nr:hypothetical protein C2G38_2042741 [Gigaspora rosea]
MSGIVTKIIEKYNFSPKMSVSDLEVGTGYINLVSNLGLPELLINPGLNLKNIRPGITITKPSKSLEEEIVREIAKRILQNRYGFSKDQVNALFTIQTNVQCESISGKTLNIAIFNKHQKRMEEETIGEMAHRLLWDTEKANEIQRDRCKFVEAFERIDYPDRFTLESVKERLNKYDIFTLPDLQALADVMIMLCICPTELTSLRITDARVTEQWLSPTISTVKSLSSLDDSESESDPDQNKDKDAVSLAKQVPEVLKIDFFLLTLDSVYTY